MSDILQWLGAGAGLSASAALMQYQFASSKRRGVEMLGPMLWRRLRDHRRHTKARLAELDAVNTERARRIAADWKTEVNRHVTIEPTPPRQDWCQRCNEIRPAKVMRWLDDDYLCALCRSVDGVVYTTAAQADAACRRAKAGKAVKLADGEFVAAISDQNSDVSIPMPPPGGGGIGRLADLPIIVQPTGQACARPCPCPIHREREPRTFVSNMHRTKVAPGSLVDQVLRMDEPKIECDGKRGNHGDPLVVCTMCAGTELTDEVDDAYTARRWYGTESHWA